MACTKSEGCFTATGFEWTYELFPGEGHGYWLQYSCLETSTNRGTWRGTAHGIAKNQIWLSNQHFFFFYEFFHQEELIIFRAGAGSQSFEKCVRFTLHFASPGTYSVIVFIINLGILPVYVM